MYRRHGTTLIETLIGVAIIGFVMTFALAMFSLSTEKLARSKHRVLATALATEQVEIIRNLPYTQVGTVGTTCEVTGTMPYESSVVRSNVTFTVNTCVKWVDDPFDGCVGIVIGQPNQSRCFDGTIVNKSPDTIPTDYKLAEVTVTWPGGDTPIKFVSTVAPKSLESPSNTGSLLISVFDASGLPVPTAHVMVTDPNIVPIDSYTDPQGKLQLLGLTPDVSNYHVVVTKAGYTTDQTYAISAQVPNPVLQDFSITAGGVLDTSFTIDRVSSLAFTTEDAATCSAIPNVAFNLKGQNLKSRPPSPVLKYDTDFTTGSSAPNIGKVTANDLEWDQYTLLLSGTSHTIAGIIPPASLNVLPNTNPLVQLILVSYSANSLLANVKDINTNLPISGATVDVAGVGVQTTGQGSWAQTDWSGGGTIEPPPAFFTDTTKTKFATEDGNIDWFTTPGQVSLQKTTASDSVTESFDATTYEDSSTTAVWDTSAGQLHLPQTSGLYDATAVAQSLKLPTIAGRIISATLSATDQANGQTIQYALAADGATYENVTPGVAHTFAATGDDLRFRVTLGTSDTTVTPVVSNIAIALTAEVYAASANLTSSTFDTGSTSSFIGLTWNPESQGGNVGVDAVRFQLATNDDATSWNFVGWDGTAATYFTSSGTSVPVALQAKRYVRYKLFLQTSDRKFTPGVTDVSLGYTTGCTPPGQTFFGGLSNLLSPYTVTITKAGYATISVEVDVNGNVQNTFSLIPN